MTPTLGTQAFALARKGKTWAEIAATLGATYQQVYRAAHRVAREWDVPVYLKRPYRGKRPDRPLSQAIRAKGLTLKQAAAQIGASRAELTAWAAGRYQPRPQHRAALRELLGDGVDLGLSGAHVAPETACAPVPWHYGARGEYAYTERGKGRSWRDIGQALGHPWEVATHRAHQHARDYATARALPWPPIAMPSTDQAPTKGQRAYEFRKAGRWWGEIGKALEMPRKGSAHDAAERYAHANGLPWPPE